MQTPCALARSSAALQPGRKTSSKSVQAHQSNERGTTCMDRLRATSKRNGAFVLNIDTSAPSERRMPGVLSELPVSRTNTPSASLMLSIQRRTCRSSFFAIA